MASQTGSDIEKAEIRLTIQSWLLNEGFKIYKSTDEEIDKHKIGFENGLPFKKDGKIVWFGDKAVVLLSYHYDTFRFEHEAKIVNEPIALNDYLLLLELFGIIPYKNSIGETEKIVFDKIIPATIQGLLLKIRYKVTAISNSKYFYGVTKMELDTYTINFNNSLISIYNTIDNSEPVLLGMFYIKTLDVMSYFILFLALGVINTDDFLIINNSVKDESH